MFWAVKSREVADPKQQRRRACALGGTWAGGLPDVPNGHAGHLIPTGRRPQHSLGALACVCIIDMHTLAQGHSFLPSLDLCLLLWITIRSSPSILDAACWCISVARHIWKPTAEAFHRGFHRRTGHLDGSPLDSSSISARCGSEA